MPIVALVPSDGLKPGATLDLANAVILGEVPNNNPFHSRSGADIFPNGTFALGTFGGSSGAASIWQWNGGVSFTKLATVGSPAGTTGTWQAFAVSGSNMWASDDSAGTASQVFRRFDSNGVVNKNTSIITATTQEINAIAANAADSIMYYVDSTSPTRVRRWDLVNNIALSDLVTTTDPVVALWAIPGSSDLAILTQTIWSGVNPVRARLIRYTTAAAVVFNSDFYDIPAAFTDTTIEVGRDPSLTSAWIRTPSAPAYTQTTASIYLQVDFGTGNVLTSPTIAVNADGAPTATCPFIVLQDVARVPCASFT